MEQRSSTVTKAIEILFCLREAGEPIGVSSLAKTLGMQKSGVHRLLKSLESRRLVEQLEDLRYTLGIGLVTLASGVADGDPLLRAAGPVMEKLSQSIGETVFLVTACDGVLRVVAKRESTGFLRASPELGSEIPVSKTAVGKLHALFARERLIKVPRISAAEKKSILERGYAMNHEEWQPGLSVIAVPVRNGGGFVSALALATVAQRMEILSEKKLAGLLIEASQKIGEALP